MKKLAGVLLLGTSGVIAPMKTEHMETACHIKENKIIYPLAYRTHTHQLGKVVSGYKVRKNQYGIDEWTLLGKRDPLTPQMFYPVENTDTIIKGDQLAARCTMESHRQTPTYIGYVFMHKYIYILINFEWLFILIIVERLIIIITSCTL